MNKYVVIGIVLLLIIGVGAFYRANFVAEEDKPITTGIERNITITVHKNTWAFDPEYIEADQGDKVILTVINQDDYDHGFAIDAFGISQRMPALETIRIEFVVTKAGDFPYYCSVSCGSGVVDGVERGHFDQVGRLHVRSAISETVDYEPETNVDFAKQAREEAVITTSKEQAAKLGYDTDTLNALFDENNQLWNIYKTTEDVSSVNLPESGYQAVLYRNSSSQPVLWVFINTASGEALDVFEVK